MEDFLDVVWEYIAAFFVYVGDGGYALLDYFHFLGPAIVISCLALLTVLVTRILSRFITTRRYMELEKEYLHWYQLRQEAMKCEDGDKGRRMARNIDKAELNRAYYDYFFEGLLLGIIRRILPIFLMFAFVNEYYKPTMLLETFGRDYVMRLVASDASVTLVGAPFWFFCSLLVGYLLLAMAGFWFRRLSATNKGASNEFGVTVQ